MLFVSILPPSGQNLAITVGKPYDTFQVVTFSDGSQKVELHATSARALADALAVAAYGPDARITTALVEEEPEYDPTTCEYCNRPFCTADCDDAECVGCHV